MKSSILYRVVSFVLLAIVSVFPVAATTPVAIMGEPEVSVDRMYLFVKSHNENFSRDVAEAFYTIGLKYGVRGDIALCQAVLETGWFGFNDGTAVRPDQYNFGGLGVTRFGETGNSFTTMEEGVTALVQHLYAYATRDAIPEGEIIVDARFKLVNRGIAPTWEDLSGRWAANKNYGRDILILYNQMLDFTMPESHYSQF